MRFLVVSLWMIFFFCNPGFCSHDHDSIERIVTRAMESFDRGWYKDSIRLFTSLSEHYPFSNYDSIACLKIADSYFELGQYSESITMYEHFERMYPRNDSVPYVIYRIATAYLNQTHHIETDQACADMALNNYSRLLRQFPTSKYTDIACAHIDFCYSKLSGHEFAIGIFYYKKGMYDSALSRFSKIISLYPDVGYHYNSLFYLINCERLIQEKRVR